MHTLDELSVYAEVSILTSKNILGSGDSCLKLCSFICTDEEGQRIARETLDELDWCLEQLETMHTHRSVGDLASTKVTPGSISVSE